MAGSSADDYDVGGSSSSFIEGMSNEERCPSVDSLAEWRSSEQVENGTPSTSPPYWDTDEDDDGGPKPSDLYGKYTWKIENFSQLNKREMRSNAFEVGGYKWYILIYPQGCDVSNHLSLFLCVSQHEKLLPGWGHFAQFTIAVVNKDSKKSKYSDTLHRFWKKEHDWGWKKFIELSKVSDGFIVADTLVIKAQVQVIREKAHRPFRCLDRHYRRELVRIYLSNVEQICRRFVEERRGKLSKLIEDKMRWSSFRAFWLGVDQIGRRRMSRDKTDTILKVVVKQFFVDKEVTSTLVMDSLYSGLKALECQSKNKKEREVDQEELPAPMVYVEKDMFVLADDVLILLERLALEPLPLQPSPPKDDKGLQNRTKDENSGEELNKDFLMRDERCLTELGRRTVEIFVLGYIFSNNIETAYKEAVALKRQEELIREEEAAWQIENELKVKRNAAEKEKRAKKKQAKQKRNTRKGKDGGRGEKSCATIPDKNEIGSLSDRSLSEEFSSGQTPLVTEKIVKLDDASNKSDTGDDVPESVQPELNDKDTSSISWDADTSEIRPAEVSSTENHLQTEQRSRSIVDDTSSTDSAPPVVTNGPTNTNSLPYNKSHASPARAKNQRSREIHERNGFPHGGNKPSSDRTGGAAHSCNETVNCKDSQPEPVAVVSVKDHIERPEKHLVKKEVLSPQKLNSRDQVQGAKPNKLKTSEPPSSLAGPAKNSQLDSQPAKRVYDNSIASATSSEVVSGKELRTNNPPQTEKLIPQVTKSQQVPSALKSETPKLVTPSKSPAAHQVPLVPSPRPTAPIVTTVQTPLLSRSVSAAGRLGTDPSPSLPSYAPQSYRNAINSKTTACASAGFSPVISTAPSSQAVTHSQPPSAFLSSASLPPPQTSARNNGPNTVKPLFTFGTVKPETLHNHHSWKDGRLSHQETSTSGSLKPETLHNHHSWKDGRLSHQETSTSGSLFGSNLATDVSRLDIHGRPLGKPYNGVASSSASPGQAQGYMSEDFPHLGIINDLLDEDQNIGKVANGHHYTFNRQYTFPRDAAVGDPGRYDPNEQYYGEGFQRGYGSSNGHLHGLRDHPHHRQMEVLYGNDGATQNQWPYQHADPTMVNLDGSGYPYQLQDYMNSTPAENGGGYNIYRPSSRN